jgi:hypothetical protein
MLSSILRNPVRALIRFEYQRFFASVPIGSLERRIAIQYIVKFVILVKYEFYFHKQNITHYFYRDQKNFQKNHTIMVLCL